MTIEAPTRHRNSCREWIAQHDFLYAGESKQRRAFIVRKGKGLRSFDDPTGRGEISDAVLLSNGNLLFAHPFAVKLISPEKKVLWNLDAPKGTEIHTATRIGNEHVIYVQNGDLALVKVVNIKTGETRIGSKPACSKVVADCGWSSRSVPKPERGCNQRHHENNRSPFKNQERHRFRRTGPAAPRGPSCCARHSVTSRTR